MIIVRGKTDDIAPVEELRNKTDTVFVRNNVVNRFIYSAVDNLQTALKTGQPFRYLIGAIFTGVGSPDIRIFQIFLGNVSVPPVLVFCVAFVEKPCRVVSGE